MQKLHSKITKTQTTPTTLINMTEDNNKVTIILAIGLIAVSLGLLYILYKKYENTTNPHNKFNGLNNLRYNNNELWNVIRDDNGNLLNIETANKDTITMDK